MIVQFALSNIQQVSSLHFEVDLAKNQLVCLVGKNGVGKTTLIKAIRNLSLADTFEKTSSRSIFKDASAIDYAIGDERYSFTFDERLGSLNCHSAIPDALKALIAVELPLPHGERFHFYRSIGNADLDIRRCVVLEDYARPTELIEFLAEVYESDKFERLVEVSVKGRIYYCIILDDGRYVREDYFSSGEYFLVNLYKKFRSDCRLIVVDEIDISLDAAAQVHLVERLRSLCAEYQRTVVFTTHSLAMIRKLTPSELRYMETVDDGVVAIRPSSYGFINSVLFGFYGWDKYLLTEDEVLQNFLTYVIRRYCAHVFFTYKIIYVGGGDNVVSLLDRNASQQFFGSRENVIAVLDGDQRAKKAMKDRPDILCMPIESVEKALYQHYQDPGFSPRLPADAPCDEPKRVFKSFQRCWLMSELEIFERICDLNEAEMQAFAESLRVFLSPSQH